MGARTTSPLVDRVQPTVKPYLSSVDSEGSDSSGSGSSGSGSSGRLVFPDFCDTTTINARLSTNSLSRTDATVQYVAHEKLVCTS